MISIVIPTYNEEENLDDLYNKINNVMRSLKENYEILFIDDGSFDSTPKIIEKLSLKDEKVRLIKHPVNQGLGAALATGFRNVKGDVIVTLDADLTHDVGIISSFVEGIREGNDLVIGSRYVEGGGMVNVPLWRMFISKSAWFAFSTIFGMFDIKDKTNGYRAYSKLIKKLNVRTKGFPVQLEILVKMKRLNGKIKEIPTVLISRKRGRSKFDLMKSMPSYLRTVLNLSIQFHDQNSIYQ